MSNQSKQNSNQNETPKIDILATLKKIDEHSRKIEKEGKGDARALGLCVNMLAAIVYGQEQRLQKLEGPIELATPTRGWPERR